jgi:hypothetical protein
MKKNQRVAAALCILLLASAGVFVGCSSTTSVDTEDSFATPQLVQSVSCPPMEAVAEAIAAELDENCPRTVSYRNWGQENSCEKRTIGQMLDQYEGCFSDAELKLLRVRALELRHASDRRETGDPPTPIAE